MTDFARTLVTAALPYANGPIHLGHLAGVYVPADIFVRFKKIMGDEVLFICGSDEHGVPITLAAEKEGISPKELVDRNYRTMKESFEALGVQFDNYSQTSREIHHRTSSEFFLDLHGQGILKQKSTLQFYSESAGRFLPDRYVEGTCPYCAAEGARGDQCESCGSQMEPDKLIEPHSVVDGESVGLKESEHWFFPMGEMQEFLEKWIGSHPEWKENVLNYCRGWFQQGLGDRAVTRDLNWGVPVPLPNHEGKVLYVWFEAPIGYISATREWAEAKGNAEEWRSWWQDEKTRLIHFIGKDNIVFHALLFPAMLHANSEAYVLPDNVPANEFLNLEGKKLSTSRGYAVWLPDYLKSFEPDSLRYCLARNLPESRDTNFTWDDFQARHNNELADVLGNFINRTLTFVGRYFDSKVPAEGTLEEKDREALAGIEEVALKVRQQMESFQMRSTAEQLLLLSKEANRYFDEAEPWVTRKSDMARCATSLFVCCQYIRAFAGLWAMILPFSMQRLWDALNLKADLFASGWVQDDWMLKEAHPLSNPGILFEKIEDERIAQEKERLREVAG
ncbi:MAG TPA: methionine--tRNA ligase [Candidatus Krumholzibacteria bacterium]|nr:methionine--tRNA ligase [Candidatus Krumholzibacteria bacterium]